MALFISTMILLFAFTTNVGMLVHAKINLQNAADAAAYAGAAVQARQLTNVAYLNWEMRRALKEFLFYYEIRSQYAAMPCFPFNANGQRINVCQQKPGDARHDFFFEDPRENSNESGVNRLPTVCIIFDPENNYCQKNMVPGIPEFQGGGSWGVADPIVAAVQNATNQIIARKIADCLGRTDINRQFLVSWLFNPYPIQDANAIIRTGSDSSDPFPFSIGMERLGFLPRMALLRARVDNMEEALNLNMSSEGTGSLTIEESTLNFFKSVPNEKKYYFERPIQAFLSAKNNLPSIDANNGIFSEVELTELLPTSPGVPNASPDLRNPPILAKFNEITSGVTLANSKFTQDPNKERGNCGQQREVRKINGFPFGITKDPNVITYYAVRLQAKARLLFSPFGGNGIVTLSAYSAAKPFGSRIGKDIGKNPEAYMIGRGSDGIQGVAGFNCGGIDVYCFPNVPILGSDDASAGGFSRNSHLGYIVGAMRTFNKLYYGPRLAGAYAPWEVGYYTIPANYKAPLDIGLFPDNPVYNGEYFQLETPVNPVNQAAGSGLGFLSTRVMRYLDGDLASSNTLNGPFSAFVTSILSPQSMGALYDYLQTNNLDAAHLVPDPLLNDEPDLLSYVKNNGQRFTVAATVDAQKRQLTSWNNQKTSSDSDPNLGIPPESELGPDIGRSGYSVRFVSFASLAAGGRSTNDPEIDVSWTSPFSRLDAGAAGARLMDDLKKIKH